MDKKSKILIIAFVVTIFVSIFFTYKRAFIDQNFIIIEKKIVEDEKTTEEEPPNEEGQ